SFAVSVAGGAPFSYQWRKDGLPLSDGTLPGGGFASGSSSPRLVLEGVSPADEGAYDVVVTNACGSVTSGSAELTVSPPPEIGSTWSCSVRHPVGALSSVLNAVDGEVAGGSATLPDAQYGSLSHPRLWPLDGGAPMDLAPPGSVGGALLDVGPGTQVGWYWCPYW